MNKERFATSEVNATYYLGAGASAEALPVVKNWSESFETLATQLKNDETIDASFSGFKNELIGKLQWLSKKSSEFKTVDTFAKYLYLKSREELDALKNALNNYFLIQQLFHKKRDKRALIFLTTVMQVNGIFPTNFNIISWNYDFQIQFAAEHFRNEKLRVANTTLVHSGPLISYYPNLGYYQNDEYSQMVQLNGIAGFYITSERLVFNQFQNSPPENYNQLFDTITKADQTNLISFAWEHLSSSGHVQNHITRAANLIHNADILIVIGYSFPYFNREVDKILFESFKANGKKKIIYFQDPVLNGQFLRTQFNLNQSIDIKPVEQIDNFYVPIEL